MLALDPERLEARSSQHEYSIDPAQTSLGASGCNPENQGGFELEWRPERPTNWNRQMPKKREPNCNRWVIRVVNRIRHLHFFSEKIKRVSITVSTWLAKIVNPAIILDPSQLTVVGNVTPDQVFSHAIPSGSLRPKHVRARIYPSNGCVSQSVLPKTWIERQNVRIRITGRFGSRPIPGKGTTCSDA